MSGKKRRLTIYARILVTLVVIDFLNFSSFYSVVASSNIIFLIIFFKFDYQIWKLWIFLMDMNRMTEHFVSTDLNIFISFRSPSSSNVPRVVSGGGFFSGSKFKYTGRVEREVLEEMAQLSRIEPQIQRVGSLRRKASSVPVTPSTPIINEMNFQDGSKLLGWWFQKLVANLHNSQFLFIFSGILWSGFHIFKNFPKSLNPLKNLIKFS